MDDDFKFRPQTQQSRKVQGSRKVQVSGKVQGSREVLQSREDRYTDPADKVQVCSWENLFFKHPSLTGALGTFAVVSQKIAYGQSILQAYQRG